MPFVSILIFTMLDVLKILRINKLRDAESFYKANSSSTSHETPHIL
jgi:hypothetical protein